MAQKTEAPARKETAVARGREGESSEGRPSTNSCEHSAILPKQGCAAQCGTDRKGLIGRDTRGKGQCPVCHTGPHWGCPTPWRGRRTRPGCCSWRTCRSRSSRTRWWTAGSAASTAYQWLSINTVQYKGAAHTGARASKPVTREAREHRTGQAAVCAARDIGAQERGHRPATTHGRTDEGGREDNGVERHVVLPHELHQLHLDSEVCTAKPTKAVGRRGHKG
jgi:hypothetical protein